MSHDDYNRIDITKLEKTTDVTDIEIGCLLYITNDKYHWSKGATGIVIIAKCNSINQREHTNEYAVMLQDLYAIKGEVITGTWELTQRHLDDSYEIYPITKKEYPEYYL